MLLFSPISYSQRSYSNKQSLLTFKMSQQSLQFQHCFISLILDQIYISSDSLTTDFIKVMKTIDSFWQIMLVVLNVQ